MQFRSEDYEVVEGATVAVSLYC